MMDDVLFQQAVRLTAPATGSRLSWYEMYVADGHVLRIDGVYRGEVVRDDKPGDYYEPYWWSAHSVLTGWVEGRSRTRIEAARQVEKVAAKWLWVDGRGQVSEVIFLWENIIVSYREIEVIVGRSCALQMHGA